MAKSESIHPQLPNPSYLLPLKILSSYQRRHGGKDQYQVCVLRQAEGLVGGIQLYLHRPSRQCQLPTNAQHSEELERRQRCQGRGAHGKEYYGMLPTLENSFMVRSNFPVYQVRRAIKGFLSEFPEYERLLPHVKGSSEFLTRNRRTSYVVGNVGFIFTNDDLSKTRDVILAERVAAPARAGAIAPLDVYVPAGNTGMEPGKTSFFQALGVPTKIARGTIEITTDLKLVEANTKVGASEATLLNMLNISPFTYGMKIAQVYDGGQTFSPSVLDIKEEQLLAALTSAIKTITTISLAANYPTLPSVFHSIINSYKKVLAVAVETDYSWEGIDELKDRIANPDAYASAAPAAAADEPAAETKAAEEEEKKEDSGSESEGGLYFPN